MLPVRESVAAEVRNVMFVAAHEPKSRPPQTNTAQCGAVATSDLHSKQSEVSCRRIVSFSELCYTG